MNDEWQPNGLCRGTHAHLFFHNRGFFCTFHSVFFRIFLLRRFFYNCGLGFPGAEILFHQTV